MTALKTSCLTLGLALLGTFEWLSPACARETSAAPASVLPPAAHADILAGLGLAGASATLTAIASPASVCVAAPQSADAATPSGLAVRGSASSAGSAGNAPEVDLDASDDVNVDQLCANPQCGTVHRIDLLPQVVFEKLEELPLLGAFVLPVTKGMTIEPGDGLPTLTFALKPTQIRRGTGLVAIARF